MRRLAAGFLLLALTACGTGGEAPRPRAEETAPATPPLAEPVPGKSSGRLGCGATKVAFPAMPAGLTREGSFARLGSLTRRLTVKGTTWRENDEQVYVGVVCGVRAAEQFATLVDRSTLTAYKGRPALRWTTRTGMYNFMWLARPGTAVYIAATPGLATEIKPIAAGVTTSG
ncbi:hypothetical protein [Nonomuraea sp. NPDC002799]